MTKKDIEDIIKIICPNDEDFEKPIISPAYLKKELEALALEQESKTEWISVNKRLPEYMVPVLTWDGNTFCVEKRIPYIRGDGEIIEGDWWVSDDYDESDSKYYPNLRDGACIAWIPIPEPYKMESEVKE